jgi:HD superfamily phosphohydrolase
MKTPATVVFAGKVRDALHGTIGFTALEKSIIDSPEFQRLRRIGQTAFVRYVFPSAVHSRFEHALGTMHLAGLVFEKIVRNQERMLASVDEALLHLSEKGGERARERSESILSTRSALAEMSASPYLLQCVRIAGLVHDMGHPPFSHNSESFLPKWKSFLSDVRAFGLPSFLMSYYENKASENPDSRVRHEAFTLLLSMRVFDKHAALISEDMARDVLCILETDIEPDSKSAIARYGLQPLLHEIVSGEVDADRMDYLMRDARQCGVVYGIFDMERIVDSTAFYRDSGGLCHLAMRKSGLAAFEDYLRARLSMYEQVYFHKTSTACQAMLEYAHELMGAFSLPTEPEKYLSLDDASFLTHAKAAALATPESEFGLCILEDLLLYRKLWKRIYEENIPRQHASSTPSLCNVVSEKLSAECIPHKLIENKTTLTRFVPRGRRSDSANVLRVIVKDVHSLRRLEPIEAHSTLVNRLDEENVIRRIFVARERTDGFSISLRDIQAQVAHLAGTL